METWKWGHTPRASWFTLTAGTQLLGAQAVKGCTAIPASQAGNLWIMWCCCLLGASGASSSSHISDKKGCVHIYEVYSRTGARPAQPAWRQLLVSRCSSVLINVPCGKNVAYWSSPLKADLIFLFFSLQDSGTNSSGSPGYKDAHITVGQRDGYSPFLNNL